MRIACVLITHLRVSVELQRRPHLVNRPAVIADRARGRPLVVDRSPACAGAAAGMALEEALSRNAGTVVLDADEPSYQRAFRLVLVDLQGVSDRVESAGLGIAYVRLDGLERLHGGEERVVHALLHSLPVYLRPRIGVGDAKFPTFVAARTSDAPGVAHVPPDAAAFLAPRSVDLLPVGPMCTRPHAPLRPAHHGRRRSDEAGAAHRPVRGRGQESVGALPGHRRRLRGPASLRGGCRRAHRLPFASASAEWLLTAVDTLLKRAYARPRMQGRYAGRVTLECALERAAPWERPINFKQPVGNWEQAATLVRRQLERELPVAPVEEVALTLSGITGEAGTQPGLFPDARKDRDLRVLDAERQIQARIGGNHALYRVVDVAPWHPAPGDAGGAGPHRPIGKGRDEAPLRTGGSSSTGGPST